MTMSDLTSSVIERRNHRANSDVFNDHANWLLSRNKNCKSVATFDNQLRWPSGKSIHLGSYRLGFDSESGHTNGFEIDIHSFPAGRLVLKGQCGEQASKFTSCTVGKGT